MLQNTHFDGNIITNNIQNEGLDYGQLYYIRRIKALKN